MALSCFYMLRLRSRFKIWSIQRIRLVGFFLWPSNCLVFEKEQSTWSAYFLTVQAGASYRTTSTTLSASSVMPITSTTQTGDGKERKPAPSRGQECWASSSRAPLPSAARSQPPLVPAPVVLESGLEGLWARGRKKKCCPQPAPQSRVLAPHQSPLLGLLQCHVQQLPLVNLSAGQLFRNSPSFLGGTERVVVFCWFFFFLEIKLGPSF